MYIRLIKDMYVGGRTNIRTPGGVTNDFYIDMDLYQGSNLSRFIFTLVIDELRKGIQDELLWCILFTDDIILIYETREEVNGELERSRYTLESRSFKVSRSKSKYLLCCCNRGENERGEVTIDGMTTPKVEKFEYLGLIIQ